MTTEIITPSLLVLFPVFVALITFTLRNFPRLVLASSLAGCLTHLFLSLILLSRVLKQGMIGENLGGWPAPFGICLLADPLSASMIIISCTIIFFGILYGVSTTNQEWELSLFHPLLQIKLCGLSGAFLTTDLFNLFVWFEVILLTSFVLMSRSFEKDSISGSFKYVTLNLFSSVVFLSALGLLYASAGTLNMADLSLKMKNLADNSTVISSANLLFFAFMLKAAVFPLCFWLPASYHTTGTAISAVFAGLLTKLGLYAFLRVSTLIFPFHIQNSNSVFIIFACLSMIFGVLGAAGSKNGRRILSFHIISQIGYLFLGIVIATSGALTATMYYFFHHIIAKSNLFFIAGLIETYSKQKSVYKQGNILKKNVLISGAFIVSAGALAGLPPTSGFFAKFSLMLAVAEAEQYTALLICAIVGFLTLFSMTKVWNETYLKKAPKSKYHVADKTPVTLNQYATILGLAAISMSLVVAGPMIFNFCSLIANDLMHPELYIELVLNKQRF